MKSRWKIVKATAQGINYPWSLGYPTRRAASAAAARLRRVANGGDFRVEKMTAEDEALASQLEREQ